MNDELADELDVERGVVAELDATEDVAAVDAGILVVAITSDDGQE